MTENIKICLKKKERKKLFPALQPIMEYIQAICNLDTYTFYKNKTAQNNQRQ